ncbi:hypothetical protein Hanom_Chr12g01141551 [Helianthus anomalus]
MIVFKPSQLGSAQGTSSGTVEEIQQLESISYIESSLSGTYSVPSTTDLALQALLALNEMKKIDDAEIDQMSSEPETADVDNVEEIVFEGNEKKSSYVREYGTEFAPFNEEWLKDIVEVIVEHLKNRDTSENATDAFFEWRKHLRKRTHMEEFSAGCS